MTPTITLVQFLPPWRSLSGVRRYQLNSDGSMTRVKDAKRKKVLRKAVKHVDGLFLKPVWPSDRGLILISHEGDQRLYETRGRKITPGTKGIDLDDPNFEMGIQERGLYRRYCFTNGEETYVFRDFSARLIGPQRAAWDIFPEDDFSAFARLINILETDELREKLLTDFDRHRFKYSKWLNRERSKFQS